MLFTFYYLRLCGVCLTYTVFMRSQTQVGLPCVMLVPDPERIRIKNLQNAIGSGLTKIRVLIPLAIMSTL